MSNVNLDASGLIKGLAELDEKVLQAGMLYGDTAGTMMVNDAKTNAPWTDRTGNSRQTIDHKVVNKGNSIEIQIRGNTPHFKYLELAMEKRFAILWPTVQKWQSEVIRGWAKMLWK